MTTLPFQSEHDVERALPGVVEHLRSGGLLAYPTETVYGIGCLLRADALEELAAFKGGREHKSFLLLIASPAQAENLIWTPAALKLSAAFWPGPLTLALPARPETYPARVVSSNGTVAVRVTPHPGLQRLLQRLEQPITSSSANLPGTAPATSLRQVEALLTNAAEARTLILDGGTLPPALPSTVVDCSVDPPRVARHGAVTVEELRRVLHELDA
jgi:L-threonylcarbamoyladenylate synthase